MVFLNIFLHQNINTEKNGSLSFCSLKMLNREITVEKSIKCAGCIVQCNNISDRVVIYNIRLPTNELNFALDVNYHLSGSVHGAHMKFF